MIFFFEIKRKKIHEFWFNSNETVETKIYIWFSWQKYSEKKNSGQKNSGQKNSGQKYSRQKYSGLAAYWAIHFQSVALSYCMPIPFTVLI